MKYGTLFPTLMACAVVLSVFPEHGLAQKEKSDPVEEAFGEGFYFDWGTSFDEVELAFEKGDYSAFNNGLAILVELTPAGQKKVFPEGTYLGIPVAKATLIVSIKPNVGLSMAEIIFDMDKYAFDARNEQFDDDDQLVSKHWMTILSKEFGPAKLIQKTPPRQYQFGTGNGKVSLTYSDYGWEDTGLVIECNDVPKGRSARVQRNPKQQQLR